LVWRRDGTHLPSQSRDVERDHVPQNVEVNVEASK
jgi:hypothetical protein